MVKLWQKLLLSRGDEYQVWEMFHENSKGSKYQNGPSEQEVVQKMEQLHETLPFVGYPIIELPDPLRQLNISVDQAISCRRSIRQFLPSNMDLEQLSTILYFAYGMSPDTTKTGSLYSYRMVPSGGGLYPLDIFLHANQTNSLPPGLYHYNPLKHHLVLVKKGDAAMEIAKAMVQPYITDNALVTIFVSAVFERSIFKYGNRGYRFIFLEAGHVAQNINLVSQAFRFGCLNIGGYLDRQIDDLLDFDGLTQSTIYVLAIGNPDTSFA